MIANPQCCEFKRIATNLITFLPNLVTVISNNTNVSFKPNTNQLDTSKYISLLYATKSSLKEKEYRIYVVIILIYLI